MTEEGEEAEIGPATAETEGIMMSTAAVLGIINLIVDILSGLHRDWYEVLVRRGGICMMIGARIIPTRTGIDFLLVKAARVAVIRADLGLYLVVLAPALCASSANLLEIPHTTTLRPAAIATFSMTTEQTWRRVGHESEVLREEKKQTIDGIMINSLLRGVQHMS